MTGPEVTPAVQRAAEALYDRVYGAATTERNPEGMRHHTRGARMALAAALDVEELSAEMSRHGRGPHLAELGGGIVCPCGHPLEGEPRKTLTRRWKLHRATALRTSILGSAS